MPRVLYLSWLFCKAKEKDPINRAGKGHQPFTMISLIFQQLTSTHDRYDIQNYDTNEKKVFVGNISKNSQEYDILNKLVLN